MRASFNAIFVENGRRLFRSGMNGVPSVGNEIKFRGKTYKVLAVRIEQTRNVFDKLIVTVK